MCRLEKNFEDHWKGRPDPVDGGVGGGARAGI